MLQGVLDCTILQVQVEESGKLPPSWLSGTRLNAAVPILHLNAALRYIACTLVIHMDEFRCRCFTCGPGLECWNVPLTSEASIQRLYI